jgi:dihydrodipicolinate synthase/N-acetylneuraminate lyase
MSRDNWPTGLVTALVPPMKSDHIDLLATQHLAESQVQAGAGGPLR